ncbi:MAG: hypothetical protein CMG09_04830 [Candidatus Marinimicrobia bacterium]|nr:hypothetical protein [Candidatus Neomarinimicrobiota bacterium]
MRKKQENILEKVDKSLKDTNYQLTPTYMFVVWIPTVLLMGATFFIGSFIPMGIGLAYWCYMYSKYDNFG